MCVGVCVCQGGDASGRAARHGFCLQTPISTSTDNEAGQGRAGQHNLFDDVCDINVMAQSKGHGLSAQEVHAFPISVAWRGVAWHG